MRVPADPYPRGSRATAAPVNETMQHVIGSQLRAAYDEVVRQPVPDRFIELLSDSKIEEVRA